MTEKTISPLCRRLIEDMAIRRLGPKIQQHYIRHVKRFADFLRQSADKVTAEDVHRYQLWLASIGTTVPTVNVSATALRFFFKVTLKRRDLADAIVSVREPRRLPVVLSPEEVSRLLASTTNIKHKEVAAESLITIAADPRHLGARIGLTAVLHTWGSALTHHPHVHIIVPGGGVSLDRQHWIACRPGFFLSVRVLSRLFRRLFLERLTAAYQAGRLEFFADQAALAEPAAFKAHLAALRKHEWVVYTKRPFGGPDAVLAYLSRYTHRIAIANSRLVAFDGERATFKWKDYRAKGDAGYKLMTLDADELSAAS